MEQIKVYFPSFELAESCDNEISEGMKWNDGITTRWCEPIYDEELDGWYLIVNHEHEKTCGEFGGYSR